MNLTLISGIAKDIFDGLELDTDIDISDGVLSVSSFFSLNAFKDIEPYSFFFFYDSGYACFNMAFGKIKPTGRALELLNEFNRNSYEFKANIDEENILTISRYAPCMTDELAETYITGTFDALAADTFTECLRPLAKLCKTIQG